MLHQAPGCAIERGDIFPGSGGDSWHGNPGKSEGRFNVSGMIVCSCQLTEMPLFFCGHPLVISLTPALAVVLAVGLVTPSVEARSWMAVGAIGSHPQPPLTHANCYPSS
jgi:hypothetical protein